MALLTLIELFGWTALYLSPIVAILALIPPTVRFCPELKRASISADHTHFDNMNSALKRRLRLPVANYSLFNNPNGKGLS